MKIELSNEELIECLSEEIKDYLYDAFSHWTDDAEQSIVDNLYKPIANKIMNKFDNNKEFQEIISNNIVNQIIDEKLDINVIYERAEKKAIDIIAKKIALKTKLN
jgi:hypothetical protein